MKRSVRTSWRYREIRLKPYRMQACWREPSDSFSRMQLWLLFTIMISPQLFHINTRHPATITSQVLSNACQRLRTPTWSTFHLNCWLCKRGWVHNNYVISLSYHLATSARPSLHMCWKHIIAPKGVELAKLTVHKHHHWRLVTPVSSDIAWWWGYPCSTRYSQKLIYSAQPSSVLSWGTNTCV